MGGAVPPGSAPVARWLPSTLISEVTPASTRLTLAEDPRRPTSAASAPTAHSSPAIRSSSATPTFIGGPSGSPVTDIRPETACARRS